MAGQLANPYNGGMALFGNMARMNPLADAGQRLGQISQLNQRDALSELMAANDGKVDYSMSPTAMLATPDAQKFFGGQQGALQGDRRLDLTEQSHKDNLAAKYAQISAANARHSKSLAAGAKNRKNSLKSSFYNLAGKRFDNANTAYQDALMRENAGGPAVPDNVKQDYLQSKGTYDVMMNDLNSLFAGATGTPTSSTSSPVQTLSSPQGQTPIDSPVQTLAQNNNPMVLMNDADSGIVQTPNGPVPFRSDRMGAPETSKLFNMDPDKKAAHQKRLERQAEYYGVPVDQVESMGNQAFDTLYASSYGQPEENMFRSNREELTPQDLGKLAQHGATLKPFGQTDISRIMGQDLKVTGSGKKGIYDRELSNIDVKGVPALQILGDMAQPTGNANVDIAKTEQASDYVSQLTGKNQKKATEYAKSAFVNNPTAIQQLVRGEPNNITRDAVKKNPDLYRKAMADYKELVEDYALDQDPTKLKAIKDGAKNLKAYGIKSDEKYLDNILKSGTGNTPRHETLMEMNEAFKKFPDYNESDDGNFEMGTSPQGDLTNILDMFNDKYTDSPLGGFLETWEDFADPKVTKAIKTAWRENGMGKFSWDKFIGQFREDQTSGIFFTNEEVSPDSKFDKVMKSFSKIKK